MIEKLSRLSKAKNLVMYGVPEEKVDGNLSSLMGPDGDVDSFHRIGMPSAKCSKPRPIRVCFKTLDSKHEFLKIAKDLRPGGIRLDDDLTRLQQQEREQLSADFNSLKSKGHKPFFRGSSLKFRHADKMHTCKRNGARRAPDAQA